MKEFGTVWGSIVVLIAGSVIGYEYYLDTELRPTQYSLVSSMLMFARVQSETRKELKEYVDAKMRKGYLTKRDMDDIELRIEKTELEGELK